MQYERQVYSFLELLSDIGGLNGILVTIFFIIVSAWNYVAFDNYMVSRLFKIKKPADKIDATMDFFRRSDFIHIRWMPNLRLWLLSFLPKSWANRFIKSRRERALQRARERLDREINIIEIVKSWRYFERAIRYLLPQKKRLTIKGRSRYFQIDPEAIADKNKRKSFKLFAKRAQSVRRNNFSDGFFSSSDDLSSSKEDQEKASICDLFAENQHSDRNQFDDFQSNQSKLSGLSGSQQRLSSRSS